MCYARLFIHVTDSGVMPDTLPQSGLFRGFGLTPIYNMNFTVDNDWVEGAGADTSGYSLSVIGYYPSRHLSLVEVFDVAGNEDSITSTYKPNYDSIKPPIQNLGIWDSGTPPHVAFDTIINEGESPFDLSMLHLRYGNDGFSLFDSSGGPADLSPIPVGQYRLVQIQFKAVKTTRVVDSIVFGNDCDSLSAAIIGSGGVYDFLVTSQTWPEEPIGNCYPKTVEIENLSNDSITIDSALVGRYRAFQIGQHLSRSPFRTLRPQAYRSSLAIAPIPILLLLQIVR